MTRTENATLRRTNPWSAAALAFAIQWPSGVTEQTVAGDWNQATGVTFASDGRMFVWEKAGRVWTVENGVKSAQPMLDIRDEVGDWRDHGLLGFALDPGFASNGRVYLLYVVDFHHLAHFGTPQYDPALDEYFRDTIGRVTRYTANASDGFHSIDASSRTVLIGESIDNGIPICHQSHGVGSLVFGADGTLLVSCGDGASYESVDSGGPVSGSSNTALADGILRAKEDVGAWRAQLVDCLSGKVLRIDPDSGDGVASNPFFDAGAPRAPRSRVWALGLRNPFRAVLLPGTGSIDPSAGDPGTLAIADVGWNAREELDFCSAPAQDFGWPRFEGLELQPSYAASPASNLDAPNPLLGAGGCAQAFFEFADLLVQDSLDPPAWPNPCDASQSIPLALPRFVHVRPAIEWGHGAPARARSYKGSNASAVELGDPNSPISGAQFGGACGIAGAYLPSAALGGQFADTLVFGDYVGGWLSSIAFDAGGAPTSITPLGAPGGASAVVAAAYDASNDALAFIEYDTAGVASVKELVHTPNQPPTAVVTASANFGPSPLAVQFDASSSVDPEGAALAFEWDFGDGAVASHAAPLHVFVSPNGGQPAQRDVVLRVTDIAGNTAEAALVVSLDNTPPHVEITSPVDGALFAMAQPTLVALTADVSDAEHGAAELACSWQTILHHDDHEHPEPPDAACATSSWITPIGCDGHAYSYEFRLTVSDPAGLSTMRSVFLYPDCCGVAAASYCTAKTTSTGCTPQIHASGTAHASQSSGFVISCDHVLNQKAGILIYGTSGHAQTVFAGGLLCLRAPFRRAAPTVSSGSAPPVLDCSGVLSIDMSAFAHGALGGHPAPELLVPGTLFDAQWWQRDPGFPPPFNAMLSDAIEFVICE